RSASLYHPQRRAILHLKNQRKKIKDKSGVSDKPPFFDWSPLKNGSILVSMLSAAICAFGLYSPFFHLVHTHPDSKEGLSKRKALETLSSARCHIGFHDKG
ncbi:hypothetical protein AVEN_164072-1, partial [Araneus ventricosus]